MDSVEKQKIFIIASDILQQVNQPVHHVSSKVLDATNLALMTKGPGERPKYTVFLFQVLEIVLRVLNQVIHLFRP